MVYKVTGRCRKFVSDWLFLAELFTTAMFFNWKGARTKSHEKGDFIVISGL